MVDIFGTLGPSCEAEDTLYEMFKEGMTGIRINLSHVMLADCTDKIKRVKRAAERAGVIPKILIDLQGPELRIGDLESPIVLREESTYLLKNSNCVTTGKSLNNTSIPVDRKIIEALRVDAQILLDDGKIKAQVISCDGKSAQLKILRGEILHSRKSIAIEGITIDMPALTEADHENIAIASSLGITGVMQPFVRSSEDLKYLRSVIEGDLKIYAKIENRAGIENLESFFPYADEIIIARGDLGNSMPLWELPKVQKEISRICLENNKPFMVVTQMLSSMEHSKVPTRAEVSDIYNAVCDGASSVMVTGETAIGEYPVDVIRYLSRTANSM